MLAVIPSCAGMAIGKWKTRVSEGITSQPK
jgi:hypothetical protein